MRTWSIVRMTTNECQCNVVIVCDCATVRHRARVARGSMIERSRNDPRLCDAQRLAEIFSKFSPNVETQTRVYNEQRRNQRGRTPHHRPENLKDRPSTYRPPTTPGAEERTRTVLKSVFPPRRQPASVRELRMNTFLFWWLVLSTVCGLDLLRVALLGKMHPLFGFHHYWSRNYHAPKQESTSPADSSR